jgi:uncharacterized protein YodC (DUF2158 family)
MSRYSMANDLKKGDVVELKSGGPKMTVTDVGPMNGSVGVVFLVCGKQRSKGTFPVESLKLAE